MCVCLTASASYRLGIAATGRSGDSHRGKGATSASAAITYRPAAVTDPGPARYPPAFRPGPRMSTPGSHPITDANLSSALTRKYRCSPPPDGVATVNVEGHPAPCSPHRRANEATPSGLPACRSRSSPTTELARQPTPVFDPAGHLTAAAGSVVHRRCQPGAASLEPGTRPGPGAAARPGQIQQSQSPFSSPHSSHAVGFQQEHP